MHRFVIPLLLLFVALPAQADDRTFDPDALAKAVAPFLDDRTVAVGHLDLTRLDTNALYKQFAVLSKIKVEEIATAMQKKNAAELLQTLTKAGAKDVFLVASLSDLPTEPPFIVIPLEKGGDPKAIIEVLSKFKEPAYHFEQIGTAVVGGGEATRKRLKTLKPEARPEVAKAFAGAGDGLAQGVLVVTSDTRKILEEALPTLPPELGGGSIKVVTRDLQWISLKIDVPPQLKLHFIYQASDQDAAKALRELLVKAVKFVGEQKNLQEVPNLEKMLEMFLPKLDGDRLTLTIDDTKLTSILAPAVVQVRAAAARSQAANDMKQLGIALHSYNDAKGRFPAVASFDKKNKPLLSWRVQILPYLGQQKLYNEFHLDEPWDSEHNKKLIAKMPPVFLSPASSLTQEQGKTTFVVPVHSTAIFTGDLQGSRLADITDGTSNTVLLVDVDDKDAVIWTKPDDLKLDPKDPAKGLSSRYDGKYLFLFADGSVHFITKKIDKETLNAIFTKSGGEVVNLP